VVPEFGWLTKPYGKQVVAAVAHRQQLHLGQIHVRLRRGLLVSVECVRAPRAHHGQLAPDLFEVDIVARRRRWAIKKCTG
jgi:hypothetical protein